MRHTSQSSCPRGSTLRAPMCRCVVWLLPLALVIGSAIPSGAEIYRWTDEAGDVHFSDSLHSVPARHRKQLQTRPSDQPAPAPEARVRNAERSSSEIPLERRNGGYVAKTVVNGRETARLIVDTGATSTVLSPSVAARLGLVVRWDPPVMMNTVGGATQGGWADVESIAVGGHQASNLRVIVYEIAEGVDGLLGMDFLNLFRVEIHGKRPSMTLSPP